VDRYKTHLGWAGTVGYSSVLNAFRHQRSKHPGCCGSGSSPGCAQRLSASKIKTPPARCSRKAALWRAQRLSASKIKTQTPSCRKSRWRCCAQRLSASKIKTRRHHRQRLPVRVPVLNAFRHQRSKHPPRRNCAQCSPGAQRLSASKIKTHWH